MCILFLHINPKPASGRFRLILAANRDEAYKRPTQRADFWEEDKTVIGGRDLEPGKEGGSWLALSTQGRLAALLNIMRMGVHPPELLGRGGLVADFVKGTLSGEEYLKKVAINSDKYRPFNFLTIEVKQETIEVYAYSNTGDDPKPITICSENMGISNSSIHNPFAKVTAGVDEFTSIVQTHGYSNDRKSLNNRLLDFLKGGESHHPDAVMASFAPHIPKNELKPLSSIYVKNLQRGYGTRAHTVVTVDAENQAEFSEWAMKDPIDPDNPCWESTHSSCKLSI